MEHLRDSATFLVPNINSWRKLCCHVGSAVFDQLSPGKTFTSCRFRSTLLSMCPEAGPYDIISKIVLVVSRKLIPRKLTSDGAEETTSDLPERFRQ